MLIRLFQQASIEDRRTVEPSQSDTVPAALRAGVEASGYTVIIATDGAVGLAFFKQNRTAIALLLIDVAMPNMNGLDLADRILELDERLPVLFVSGTANNAESRVRLCGEAV